MGELIKVLKSFIIDKHIRYTIDLELNKSGEGSGKRIVHLQTERGRLEFSEATFVHLIATVLEAEEKLRSIKGLTKDYDSI